MLLSEILKKSEVPYDLVRTSPDYVYTFHTPSMSIDVHIIPKVWVSSDILNDILAQKIKADPKLEKSGVEGCKREFGSMYEVTFQPAGSNYFGMTHTNQDNVKILSTVIQILKDFTDAHKTAEIMFVANKTERSRVKLYSRIVKDLPSESNFTLIEKLDADDRIYFMLANKALL